MLDLFYKDLDKNAFAFQIYALSTRAKCLQDGLLQRNAVTVSERSPLSDKSIFYAMNEPKFNECERVAYKTLYDNLGIPEPDLIVYLKCDPRVCLERIHNRARDGEEPITIEYLEQLHNFHETLAQRSNLAIVPTSGSDIDSIVAQVERAIQIFRGSPKNTL